MEQIIRHDLEQALSTDRLSLRNPLWTRDRGAARQCKRGRRAKPGEGLATCERNGVFDHAVGVSEAKARVNLAPFATGRKSSNGPYKEFHAMNAVLSIIMLAAGALVVGAYLLWRRGAPLKQPLLMLLLAVIAVVNVLIWTLPGSSGEAPLDQVQQITGE